MRGRGRGGRPWYALSRGVGLYLCLVLVLMVREIERKMGNGLKNDGEGLDRKEGRASGEGE